MIFDPSAEFILTTAEGLRTGFGLEATKNE